MTHFRAQKWHYHDGLLIRRSRVQVPLDPQVVFEEGSCDAPPRAPPRRISAGSYVASLCADFGGSREARVDALWFRFFGGYALVMSASNRLRLQRRATNFVSVALLGKEDPPSIVLDAGALIALERGETKMRALMRRALEVRARMLIPANVLAQVWRGSAKQAALGALLKSPTAVVVSLDEPLAKAAGALCAMRHSEDPTDATVVLALPQLEAVRAIVREEVHFVAINDDPR